MCGARIDGGAAACQKLFDDLLALEYGDLTYGAVHLFSVDAYALQHSEIHSPRSNAYHLLRLGWLLEKNGDPRIGRSGSRVKKIVEGYRDFPFLPPPPKRGTLTVADVNSKTPPEEYAKQVRRWAKSVWDAWEVHHAWVRPRLDEIAD